MQELGPADGVPGVLVHGTGAWSGLWEDTASALAARGYRAIAVNLPPFDFSELDASDDCSRAVQARRLSELVAVLGGPPSILVSHSCGVGPAAEFALHEPGRLRKLVLVDAALGIGDAPESRCPYRSARRR